MSEAGQSRALRTTHAFASGVNTDFVEICEQSHHPARQNLWMNGVYDRSAKWSRADVSNQPTTARSNVAAAPREQTGQPAGYPPAGAATLCGGASHAAPTRTASTVGDQALVVRENGALVGLRQLIEEQQQDLAADLAGAPLPLVLSREFLVN